MNPLTLSPETRALLAESSTREARILLDEAATREASWMILFFVAISLAALFFLLFLRERLDRAELRATPAIQVEPQPQPKYLELAA
jgi:hypothetical protein